MHTGGVFIQTNQISRMTGGGQQILKDGSQVLVRVIADRGNGRYEGSVAGVRVNLQSSKPLSLGQTFLASISAKDGTVYITPKETNLYSQAGVQINSMQNEHLAAILSQLGLPSDSISEHLFLQFKQLGLRLDGQLMNKIRSLSIKFGGKQKSAAELLSILKQKGIDINSDELLELLHELDLDERNAGNGKQNFHQGQESNQNQNEKQNQFEMLNQLNSQPGIWFLLPFEIIQKENILGIGNLRLMLENETKLKFMNVECLYNNHRYLFNLEFENKRCKKIRFNIDDENENQTSGQNKKNDYIRKLADKMSTVAQTAQDVSIEWCDSALIDGTACKLENIQSVGGIV